MGGGDIFNSERILGNKSFTVCLLTSFNHPILRKTALNNGLYYNINHFNFLHAIVAAVIIVDVINRIEHASYIYPSRINTLHCLALKNTQMQHSTYLEEDVGWFN